MTLQTIRDTTSTAETPDWVRPVAEACAATNQLTSCIFSAVVISGNFSSGGSEKQRLRRLVEELAEKYDLEVTLDVSDTSFVANFSVSVPTDLPRRLGSSIR